MTKKTKAINADGNDKKVIREDDPSLTESFAGESMESVDDLLGKKSLSGKEDLVLLRINPARLSEDVQSELKIAASFGLAPIVAGPFKLKNVEEWSHKGVVEKFDLIQRPFHRWLPASEYFDHLKKTDVTATMEMTNSFTQSGSKTEEMNESVLELESQPGLEVPKTLESEGPRQTKSQTLTVVMPSKAAAPKPVAKISAPIKVQMPRSTMAWGMGAAFLLATFATVKVLLRKTAAPATSSTVETVQNTAAVPHQLDLSQEWPEWMKPLASEALLASGDSLMAKLGPVIEKIRMGNYQLSESELQVVKRISSPATASWAARKTAANVLAVWQALQGKNGVDQAIETLQPIRQAAPEDLVTLTNLMLFAMQKSDWSGADDLGQAALRQCSSSTCWFSQLAMAVSKARQSQMAQAEKYFQSSAEDHADPLAVFGLWSYELTQAEGEKSVIKVNALLDRAVIGDPDRMQSSPLPDGMGAVLLYQTNYSDLVAFLGGSAGNLSAAQRDFLRWRFAQLAGKGTFVPPDALVTKLAADGNPLSQILSAYLIAQNPAQINSARDKLSMALSAFKESQLSTGWPWSLAGDLQLESGNADLALSLYQAALAKSPSDRAAVYGLGQLLRRKSDYMGARQKFGEALAMDSQYVLPKLRISRFEWLRRLRHK